MSERHADDAIRQQGTTMKRRGILAAAGAIVAGIAAKQTAQPVVAAFSLQGDFDNTGTGNTNIQSPGAKPPWDTSSAVNRTVFSVNNTGTASGTNKIAIQVTAENYGIDATTVDFGAAVLGYAYGDTGVSGVSTVREGVRGATLSTAVNASGVKGVASNGVTNGVWGENTSTALNATGVFGLATTVTTTGPTVGVWGRSQSTTAGSIGTYGEAAATNAYGVRGNATGAGGVGVYGQSATGYGVLGYSTGGSASLSGISTNVNIPAFAGGNSVAGGLAASFSGTVYVNGAFVVQDPANKHGAIKHPDGSTRLLYSMESPESWIEDFGEGTLSGGKADVMLDPDFAAVVQADKYFVFLTPYGAVGALRVGVQRADGFTVEEIGGVSGGRFVYRVAAKPKTEKKLNRLEKFVPPEVPLPDVASLPKLSKPSDGPPEPKVPDVPPQGQPPARPAPAPAVPPQGSGTTQGSTPNPVQPIPQPRP
jgi:hypothetical protein